MSQLIEITGNVKVGRHVSLIGGFQCCKAIQITGNIVIGTSREHDVYKGEYEVTPKVYEQILGTNDLLMIDDVTVHEITFNKVQNEKGMTVQIGEI